MYYLTSSPLKSINHVVCIPFLSNVVSAQVVCSSQRKCMCVSTERLSSC